MLRGRQENMIMKIECMMQDLEIIWVYEAMEELLI